MLPHKPRKQRNPMGRQVRAWHRCPGRARDRCRRMHRSPCREDGTVDGRFDRRGAGCSRQGTYRDSGGQRDGRIPGSGARAGREASSRNGHRNPLGWGCWARSWQHDTARWSSLRTGHPPDEPADSQSDPIHPSAFIPHPCRSHQFKPARHALARSASGTSRR